MSGQRKLRRRNRFASTTTTPEDLHMDSLYGARLMVCSIVCYVFCYEQLMPNVRKETNRSTMRKRTRSRRELSDIDACGRALSLLPLPVVVRATTAGMDPEPYVASCDKPLVCAHLLMIQTPLTTTGGGDPLTFRRRLCP